MTFATMRKKALLTAACIAGLLATNPALAEVTVLGWPGGP